MTPKTMVLELADLIAEHTLYCSNQYQQYNLPHLSSEKALAFQEQMTQSLTHFGMWLETVKWKELNKHE